MTYWAWNELRDSNNQHFMIIYINPLKKKHYIMCISKPHTQPLVIVITGKCGNPGTIWLLKCTRLWKPRGWNESLKASTALLCIDWYKIVFCMGTIPFTAAFDPYMRQYTTAKCLFVLTSAVSTSVQNTDADLQIMSRRKKVGLCVYTHVVCKQLSRDMLANFHLPVNTYTHTHFL